MLKDAQAAGFKIYVTCDGHLDYVGFSAGLANAAIDAVNEAEVTLREGNGIRAGWAHIVNGLEEDERIADTSANDWLDHWWKRNILV
jgi:hypothetical protein